MYSKKSIGGFGEKAVVEYLEKNDYSIIAKNFSSRFGEIDIIALDKKDSKEIYEDEYRNECGEKSDGKCDRQNKCELNEEIVFIEVKTRRNLNYGVPSEAVDLNKIKHIVKAAKYFLYKTKKENSYVRFDVIEVYLGKEKYVINHIKNIDIING